MKAELLKEIRSFVKAKGYAPTVRELAESLGVGHSSVQKALVDLIEDGKINKTPGIARGISVKEARS